MTAHQALRREPADVAHELRDKVRLVEEIGRFVKLVRKGREHFGLCPFHNEKTPSFTVNEDKGFFHCFGCGAHGDVVDWVQRFYDLEFWDAVKRLESTDVRSSSSTTPQPRHAAPDNDERERTEYARGLWHRAKPATGSLVEVYLRSRAITIEPPPSLRYLAAAKHTPTGLILPALVAGLTRWPSRHVVAIQRTFLRADGTDKAPVSQPRMTLGPARGCAVRLAVADTSLGLCEGVEDGLSIMQATDTPVWACLGTSGLRAVVLPPLPSASAVTIFADSDEGGEGAARELAERLVNEGRQVSMAHPPMGKDFNDTLRAAERSAA